LWFTKHATVIDIPASEKKRKNKMSKFIRIPSLASTLIISALLCLNSCSKNELQPDIMIVKTTTYSYNETQCADPWQQFDGAYDLTPEERVLVYFESLDIEVSNIDFQPLAGDIAVCQACVCPSGNIIQLEVAPEAEEFIENLGFTPLAD